MEVYPLRPFPPRGRLSWRLRRREGGLDFGHVCGRIDRIGRIGWADVNGLGMVWGGPLVLKNFFGRCSWAFAREARCDPGMGRAVGAGGWAATWKTKKTVEY